MGVGVHGCIHVVAIDTPSPSEVLYPQREERTIPEMFLLCTSLCPKLETTARRLTLSMTVAIF